MNAEVAIIDVDRDEIDNNEFNASYRVHACGMINSYEGVNEEGRRLEEQNPIDERTVTSLQLRDMLREENLTLSQINDLFEELSIYRQQATTRTARHIPIDTSINT